jgi:hypothetical protein
VISACAGRRRDSCGDLQYVAVDRRWFKAKNAAWYLGGEIAEPPLPYPVPNKQAVCRFYFGVRVRLGLSRTGARYGSMASWIAGPAVAILTFLREADTAGANPRLVLGLPIAKRQEAASSNRKFFIKGVESIAHCERASQPSVRSWDKLTARACGRTSG